MSGPEFFQTGMGRTYYEHTLPALVKAMNRLADAKEAENKILSKFFGMTKDDIIKYASEDELFALFHTFKEYFNQLLKDEGYSKTSQALYGMIVKDSQIGDIIKKLKENYK
jgi:hypothetical protein